MPLSAILHLLLHIVVPGLLARIAFRHYWLRAWIVLLATMLVDIDHLLADPIYAPDRCSIGFHPLHTIGFILVYVAITAVPATRLIGTGLVLHMLLDFSDCVAQRGLADALSQLLSMT